MLFGTEQELITIPSALRHVHGRKWEMGSTKTQKHTGLVSFIEFHLSGICGDIPPKAKNKSLHLASYITRTEA